MPRLPFLFVPLVAAVLLVACGGDDDDSAATPTAFPTSISPSDSIPTEQLGAINAVIAASEFVVGNNNFVVGVTDASDTPQGGAQVVMTFYDNVESGTPQERFTVIAVQSAPGVGEEFVHVHADGEQHIHGGQDDNRVGYYARVTFDHAGVWGVSVQATLTDGTTGIDNRAFQVLATSTVPVPGDPAPPSDNLTAADVEDIAEIDSSPIPNDMHDVKIRDSIAAGRPLVVVFSTPAFCASRFCGPVTEEVETLHDDFRADVDFVHIEIWLDFQGRVLNPTVREWLIRPDGGLSEPWVFVIDSDGVIYDRWEGPIARNIIEEAVVEVASGKTFATR